MKPIRLLLLILCLCPLAVYAQSAEVGGVVQDPSGAVVPKASIEFRNQDTGIRRQATTNSSGAYQIGGIDPGKYDAIIQASGFKALTQENIVFHVGDKAKIDFKLRVGSSTENITVDGGGLQINTTDGSVSTVIERKFVENIPLNGRSFQDLISITPGVVTQSPQYTQGQAYGDFSVNGQRTQSNYYMVDGVSGNLNPGIGSGVPQPATGGAVGAATALGTTQSLLPVDALQEFRVESSTYSAEYGRSPGGQFSLITRSGTNDVHGTVFDYLRNNYFDANDWFNDHFQKPITALRQNDFGGTLGGPIWVPRLYKGQNRSFFFVAYEGLRLTQPQSAAIAYVPDIFMRQQAAPALQAIMNAYPLPNGTDYGTAANPSLAQFIAPYSLPGSIDSTSVRLDQTFSPKLRVFFRFGDTPSSSSSRTLSAVTKNEVNLTSYTFGASSQFSDATYNDFRIEYARGNAATYKTLDTFGGATPTSLTGAFGMGPTSTPYFLIYLTIPGVGAGTAPLQTVNSTSLGRQWNVTDTFSVNIGHHLIKSGVDFRRVKTSLNPASPYVLTEFTSAHALAVDSQSYAYVQKINASEPIINEFSAFVQDEWRVSSRVSMSSGLRWEVDPPPTGGNGLDAFTLLGNINNPSTLQVAPRGTPLWKTTWYNFAPRLGAAWTANNKSHEETVVRAGGGAFFDTDNELATIGFYQGLGFTGIQYVTGTPLPLTPAQLNFSPSTTAPYTSTAIVAFPTHLQLPYTLEWNASLQQALGRSQALNISYVGANGRRLIQEQRSSLTALNPNFGTVYYLQNKVTSNYQALQVQFQRSVSRGLQAIASYTWSHSIDFGSTDSALPLARGNSDFDVRHNLQAGVTWNLPEYKGEQILSYVASHWAVDGRFMLRTGFPVTVTGNLFTDPFSGSQYYGNVNLIPGRPLYLYGKQYPGGRMLNGGPTTTAGTAAFVIPTGTDPGNAPRNIARGLGESQVNFAVRREFPLYKRASLQFRAEAFNIFNHPNFGYVDPSLTDATFGQATKMLNQSLGTVSSQYQQGGPRSMQFALKIQF